MMRLPLAILAVSTALLLALQGFAPAEAQNARFENAGDAREALDGARRQQRNARARGMRLEQQAAQTQEAADKAMRQAAAVAARIQQAEAGIAVAEAELALIDGQRRALDQRLAAKRQPLVRLTAALQSMARRPLVLSALQPVSLGDLVHTRAVLDSTIPLIRARTAGLRSELDRARELARERRGTLAAMRGNEQALASRRSDLVALAQSQRLVSRRASGSANREAVRALALAERTRDLDSLVGQLEEAGDLRARLAALPGPIMRPARPEETALAARAAPRPTPSATAPPARYQLPVTGRIITGFGEAASSGTRQSGLVLAPPAGAQVVAPGAGRVAFAGPYRGYGRIVIIEHANGWTSLVTGLGKLDVAVGDTLTAGSPLGLAPRRAPEIILELRRQGEPVNPLDHLL